MAKSRTRAQGRKNLEAQRRRDRLEEEGFDYEAMPLPTWYKVIMFGLMILGLAWIIVWYLSEGRLPLQALGGWNIMVGFVIALAGFVMTTRWQ